MKKQKVKYEEVLRCPVAYKVILNSVSMRNVLVKNGVQFVDLLGNVFLPFVELYCRKFIENSLSKITQIITQSLEEQPAIFC